MPKLTTGEVRLSYAHLFEPKSIQGSDPKYSVSLIIDKGDTATIQKIQKAIEEAIAEGKDSKWNGKVPPNLKLPLRDGDEERDDEAYENSYFINANSPQDRPPTIIKPNPNRTGPHDKYERVVDPTEVYSGCYGAASISFSPFNANGNKGVAVGLNHILKLRDGEPLGGRSRAEEDFAEFELPENDGMGLLD